MIITATDNSRPEADPTDARSLDDMRSIAVPSRLIVPRLDARPARRPRSTASYGADAAACACIARVNSTRCSLDPCRAAPVFSRSKPRTSRLRRFCTAPRRHVADRGHFIGRSPLFSNARLQTLVATVDLARAERFYSDVLSLPLVARNHGALVYEVGGQPLRVSPVPALAPSEHAVLGFVVKDLNGAIAQLALRGVHLEFFPQMPHDSLGVISLGDGTRVAWFRDPDGNLLSAVQYAA